MADTQRSLAELNVLLANNTSGDISPQDVRDLMVSLIPTHGEISQNENALATTINNTADYEDVALSGTTFSYGNDMDSPASGQLRYTGINPRIFHLSCSLSFTSVNNNQIIHFRFGVNGVPDSRSQIQRKVGTGSDVGAAAIQLIESFNSGDIITLMVRNESSSANVRIQDINLSGVGMIE